MVPFRDDGEVMMRIRKAVFPAAGLGTRFLPATKAQPKEMLPLVDKPLIQYVIEEAVQAGYGILRSSRAAERTRLKIISMSPTNSSRSLQQETRRICLRKFDMISNMVNVTYVRQKEALGLGHAILMSREAVGAEPFAVMLGDDIIDGPFPV